MKLFRPLRLALWTSRRRVVCRSRSITLQTVSQTEVQNRVIRIPRGRKPYNFNKLEGNAIVTIAKLEAQIENSTNHKEKMNLKNKLSAYRSRLQKNAKSKQQEDLLNLRNVQIEIMLGTLKQELTAERYERIFSRMQQK